MFFRLSEEYVRHYPLREQCKVSVQLLFRVRRYLTMAGETQSAGTEPDRREMPDLQEVPDPASFLARANRRSLGKFDPSTQYKPT